LERVVAEALPELLVEHLAEIPYFQPLHLLVVEAGQDLMGLGELLVLRVVLAEAVLALLVVELVILHQ
jgi:hypothetical protein